MVHGFTAQEVFQALRLPGHTAKTQNVATGAHMLTLDEREELSRREHYISLFFQGASGAAFMAYSTTKLVIMENL
jgi:hypothetical protein